ncbi:MULTISPECIES: NAD-glutamate dehydrogenase [unclassified Neorhizobium]|uniref:NAD-glutamate dehydrogenase n=1 Tax=unclassified Neorhizobium TaxID=2629175 RepID=UPI001FF53789|nr:MULTISPECIES: NAD-glutamate dehydrogenase [unclassified Neorhizobium]MCJ9669153.1 NAD-glutamate dehydrogenase [Neorhizobium sp. SHOUNA12B]MCJ9744421.1 NAD-glutamate dehydrogenase [Neorhizobium sp. SHOUNA12A]
MAVRQNPKREKQIESARKIVAASKGPHLDPLILFARASTDDLESYTPEMLALSANHAAERLMAWTRIRADITVEPIAGVAPDGIPVSVLTVVDRNMPFLFDSVMGEVTATHRDLTMAVHPILVVEPGKDPALRSNEQPGNPAHHVSLIQIHLSPLNEEQAASLTERIRYILDQVHLSITDWGSMLEVLDGAAKQLNNSTSRRKADRDEALAFLDWLRDDNFTFLGMREYVYSGKGTEAKVERGKGRGLGILSDPDVLVLRQGKDAVTTTPEILEFLDGPDFLIVTKANVKSVVHRRAYMDYVGVKRFDEQGEVVGELRVVGLFTATAYTHSVRDIPLLRAKTGRVEEQFGFDPDSHSGRMLENTLESYPRDDLFQIDVDLLARFCEQIMALSERPRVRVLPRIDHFDRFVSVIVYVPREDYNSLVREKVGDYLTKVYDGHVSAYYPAFPEGGVARVHMIIGRRGGKTPRIAQAKLEEAIRLIATPWEDRFAALAEKGPRLTVTQAFQEAFSPEETFADLPDIAACAAGETIRIAFYRRPGDPASTVSLKIFHKDRHLSLSRRVPLLENLGFHAVSEQTFEIQVGPENDRSQVVLHDMELQLGDGREVDLSREGLALEEAFLSAFEGLIDNDGFNRLVLLAGLSAREVTVLRAYSRYLRQTGIVYSQAYIGDTLVKYPAISAAIFRLFRDGFDPKITEKARVKKLTDHHAEIEEALGNVPNLDEDRTLRRFVNAVDATLRTNYFQRDPNGAPYRMFAFKLDPKLLDGLPEPRPFREIFVYGTEVEGVHLRFGKVARGGLRWSDRGEDYRTEILGLVKAQQVKNAVIVPVGAKGGFFPKMLPPASARDAFFNAGREAYKTFIRTLLSITDNIVGADIVGPPDTIRLDGDDPYFVVAADKGTATFSDTANGLAQEAGFWLDDAFASGGSVGYDHKKMGITARGAWEAVKRHFREKDIDIQTTPFTVAGVGDMSGDVFGNGMLLSRKIRLIAAFDHRDIVIDPDPDIEKSFAERERMFALPRSSWQDYDKSVLSEGAMIISRSEKSVKLTKQAAAAIGIDKTTATPFEIMTAILKSPVDLLWFGGIGTYIKAASETDTEVGDRANDPIRITAAEVRASVIGEGANLGMTQKGRIAYSLNGGRCNSDAIDNSAGVNCSDVEVNIKIALNSAMQDGRLTRDKRNQLLASMTEEVGHLVLRNNYLQPLSISLTERKGTGNREELSRLMSVLESQGQLNRKVETLPDDAELAERYSSGRPLTRPEIGVLLSYSKIVLFDALLDSSLPDDPYFSAVLKAYFPAKMQKAYTGDIQSHRLHREIVATTLANEAINRGGPGFIQQMSDMTGATAANVVKAAFLARDGFELPKLWAEIDALDGKIPGQLQNDLYARTTETFAEATHLILQTQVGSGDVDGAMSRLKAAIKGLRSSLAGEDFVETAARASELEAQGIPASLAREILLLSTLVLVPEIMLIADRTGETMARATESYFTVTETFRINRLIGAGERISTSEHYESLALSRSLQQLASARRDIVIAAMTAHPKEKKPLEAWVGGDRVRVNRIGAELVTLSESGELTLPKITVAAGLLSDLAHGRAM